MANKDEQPETRVDSKEDVSVQDRPRDALRDSAEVFRRVGAGVVRRYLHEEVDGHAQHELGDQHHQCVKEAHPKRGASVHRRDKSIFN